MENVVDKTLSRLEELILQGRFEELETDTLEIKPVPSDSGSWAERYKTACAFLNTRGGILILGITEEGQGTNRRYVHSGYHPHAEPKLREFRSQFSERDGRQLSLSENFPEPELRDFMGGKVAVQYVDELSADRRFAFYKHKAYKRHLTADVVIAAAEIERQEEFKEEARQARELQPVEGVTPAGLSIDKLNEYITALNRGVKIETLKPDLPSATPFLERKCFVKDGRVTTLGMLVCGEHPEDYLGFRCQVHGYVDLPQSIAQDKQDLSGNILPLMESSLAYILRNIQVGITVERGGSSRPQYPEALLRETVNNALAHRSYSHDKQVILAIRPGVHLSIQNPGSFREGLLIRATDGPVPLLRIIPEAKPRNPKLADALRVFRKWEGRGIGMATLTDLCLKNEIDLPYYTFKTEDVTLYLRAGQLLDDRMRRLFKAFDRYIESKLQGYQLAESQQLVLSYLIKSEWDNELSRYTVLLTPDNNHYNELVALERHGLIEKHPASTSIYHIYVVDRELAKKDYIDELRGLYGEVSFDALPSFHKDILTVVYRLNHFSKEVVASAKEVSFSLWYARGERGDIKGFDTFYRKVRNAFNTLAKNGFLFKPTGSRGYLLDKDSAGEMLRASSERE